MTTMHDCPVCGGSALVLFGPDARFAYIRTGWPTPMGYMARCNFVECSAPTFTRESHEAAVEAWNERVRDWPATP